LSKQVKERVASDEWKRGKVVCHGGPEAGSFVHSADGPVLSDFSAARLGHPAEDLAHWVVGNAAERGQWDEDFIATAVSPYLEALRESGVNRDTTEAESAFRIAFFGACKDLLLNIQAPAHTVDIVRSAAPQQRWQYFSRQQADWVDFPPEDEVALSFAEWECCSEVVLPQLGARVKMGTDRRDDSGQPVRNAFDIPQALDEDSPEGARLVQVQAVYSALERVCSPLFGANDWCICPFVAD